MIRLWLLTAVLLALALAGCGPDCDAYCRKMADCARPTPFDVSACIVGCDDSKSDKPHTISCVIDHSCSDIAAGHCSPTGQFANP